MVDKRVSFDFAVQFSNGGGLQGQGFRLDIEGDTISDDELAAHLIRDLRLLMVSKIDMLDMACFLAAPSSVCDISARSGSIAVI